MSLSLRARLTLAYGGSFATILILIFVTLHRILGPQLLGDLDRQLNAYTRNVADDIATANAYADRTVIERIVKRNASRALPERPLFTIVKVEGLTSPIRDQAVRIDPGLMTALSNDAVASDEAQSRSVNVAGNSDVRVRTILIRLNDEVIGTVQAGRSEVGVEDTLDLLQRMLLIQGGLGIALALALGYLVANQGLRPLKRVVALAQRIHAGRLDERLNIKYGPHEVVEVASTFDGMLARIYEQFDQQRRFVADVSHELRTPLTALRGNIDVLLLDPDLPEDVAAQLRLVSAECARLIRLSTNLLLVAQAEMDRPPDRREVDLHELCIEVFHQMRDAKPGVAVRLVHEDQVRVIGDRDRLKQLLLNLVDNAIKYTPAGGNVAIGLHREPGWARIEVRDTGIGIPKEQQDKIFQRFYTVDQKTDRTVKGAGLGLSIVDWVVKTHDGQISLDSAPGEGTLFTVRLPSMEREPAPDDDTAGDDFDAIEQERSAPVTAV